MKRDAVNSEILDRVPPHDVEAERQTIGCLLLDPSRCVEIGQILAPDDFYVDAHRRLYAHILGLYGDGGRVDQVLLLDRLREAGELEVIGGTAYLHEVATAVFTAGSVASYAAVVSKHAKRRRLIHSATQTLVAAYDDGRNADEIASSAAERMLTVTSASNTATVDTPTLFAQTLQELADESVRPIGKTIGLWSFDREIGGLYPGELTILAARPSMGKTALGTQIDLHFAEHGRHTLFMSLEMSARALALRILANRAGVDSQRIRNRSLSDNDRRNLVVGNADLPIEYLDIVDRPRMSTTEIRWEVMRRRQKHSLDLIVIDYLTRLQPIDPRAPRYLQIGQMTGDLKRLALEFDVPVLCLAQLGRAAEAKGETRPRLSHLRESGDIEQDADVVAFLHRPERIDRDDPDNHGQAFLYVEKNRNGPCGEYELRFDGPTGRFTDLSAPTPYPEFEEWGG